LPRTRSRARAGEGAQPLPPASPRIAERRASAPTRYDQPLSEQARIFFKRRGTAPVRFCHRGYPASTEPHTSSTSSNPRWVPSSRRKIGRAYREFSMTSDSGAFLPPERQALERQGGPSADAAPVPHPFLDSAFLARRGGNTRASSTSRCWMGDDPSAETREPSVTVCPFNPLVRTTNLWGLPFNRARRISSEGTTPRRVIPAIDPKCHPPNGPIRCGSAGEELTPCGITLELRTQSSNARLDMPVRTMPVWTTMQVAALLLP